MKDKALEEGGNQLVLGHLHLLTLSKGRSMVRLEFLKDCYPLSGGWIREELACKQEDALKMLVVRILVILWQLGMGRKLEVFQSVENFMLD